MVRMRYSAARVYCSGRRRICSNNALHHQANRGHVTKGYITPQKSLYFLKLYTSLTNDTLYSSKLLTELGEKLGCSMFDNSLTTERADGCLVCSYSWMPSAVRNTEWQNGETANIRPGACERQANRKKKTSQKEKNDLSIRTPTSYL